MLVVPVRKEHAWWPGTLDPVLHAAADDEIAGVIIAVPDLDWLYHLYDGGADVLLPTEAERDQPRDRRRNWLSAEQPHAPEGRPHRRTSVHPGKGLAVRCGVTRVGLTSAHNWLCQLANEPLMVTARQSRRVRCRRAARPALVRVC